MYGNEKREIYKGDVVRANVTDRGISFLFNNVWSYNYRISLIEDYFEVNCK
jgi:hypothetical protein